MHFLLTARHPNGWNYSKWHIFPPIWVAIVERIVYLCTQYEYQKIHHLLVSR